MKRSTERAGVSVPQMKHRARYNHLWPCQLILLRGATDETRAASETAAGGFSDSADGLSWNRAGPDVDRAVLVRRRPAGTHRQLTAVALDRTPHFDAAQRFIHPCFDADARPCWALASTCSPGSSAAGTAALAGCRHHIESWTCASATAFTECADDRWETVGGKRSSG